MGASRIPADRCHVVDVHEANAILPLVRILAARTRRRVALRQRLESRMMILQLVCETCSRRSPDFQEYLDKKLRYHRLGGQVDALVDRLARLGCVVRNHDASWVDFTFLRQDGLAVLCWRLGEDAVAHWHFMHETHSDRRRLAGDA
jgi:hypothetical protein